MYIIHSPLPYPYQIFTVNTFTYIQCVLQTCNKALQFVGYFLGKACKSTLKPPKPNTLITKTQQPFYNITTKNNPKTPIKIVIPTQQQNYINSTLIHTIHYIYMLSLLRRGSRWSVACHRTRHNTLYMEQHNTTPHYYNTIVTCLMSCSIMLCCIMVLDHYDTHEKRYNR